MGGTNSKTNINKLDEIKEKVDEIADDIIKNKGIGDYQFADGSKEEYRSLTDSSKCKKYAIIFAVYRESMISILQVAVLEIFCGL